MPPYPKLGDYRKRYKLIWKRNSMASYMEI